VEPAPGGVQRAHEDNHERVVIQLPNHPEEVGLGAPDAEGNPGHKSGGAVGPGALAAGRVPVATVRGAPCHAADDEAHLSPEQRREDNTSAHGDDSARQRRNYRPPLGNYIGAFIAMRPQH